MSGTYSLTKDIYVIVELSFGSTSLAISGNTPEIIDSLFILTQSDEIVQR